MIGPLGHTAIVLAFLLAGGGAISGLTGRTMWARRAAFGVLSLVFLATALMVLALVTHDFSVKYVADVGSRETPMYYTVISLWGALEGSILFWAFLLSAYTAAFLLTVRNGYTDIQP